jgi:hypothetical protein
MAKPQSSFSNPRLPASLKRVVGGINQTEPRFPSPSSQERGRSILFSNLDRQPRELS